jgi:hypothetical protein
MIWLERNSTILENTIPSTSAASYKALGLYNSWIDIHANKPRPHYNKQKPTLQYIPTGWFDGAATTNGSRSGAGGLIKISQNTFYKWTYNCGLSTNTGKTFGCLGHTISGL